MMERHTSARLRTLLSLRRPLITLLWLLVLAMPGIANAQAVLTISKSAERTTVFPGDQVVFTLDVANTGTAEATNVHIEDQLGSRLSFVSATASGNLVAPPSPGDNGALVQWTFPAVAAGTSGSLTITATALAPANFTNTASISADGISEIESNGVAVSITEEPELTISKSVSSSNVNAGDNIVYTLDISNPSGGDATSVEITDVLEAGLTFVSATHGGTAVGNTVTWNFDSIPAYQSGAVSFTALVGSVPDGTTISNTASIDSALTDPVNSNRVSINVSSKAVLSPNITASHDPVTPGQILQFTTHIENTSTNTATGVQLIGIVPSDTTYQSNLGGGIYNGTDRVSWTIGDLAPGAVSGIKTMLLLVDNPLPNGTNITYNATATASNALSVGEILIVTVESLPSMDLVKTADKTVVGPGENITYTLSYQNSGSDIADVVIVEDHLPQGTSFVNASNGGAETVPDSGIVTWDVAPVGIGESGSVTLTVEVDDFINNGKILHNVSSIATQFGLPVSAPVVDVTVSNEPNIDLVKTAPAEVEAGNQLTYTIDYHNQGTSDARNVIIADQLPPFTSFVSASNGGTESGGLVTWTLGTVPAGASGAVSLVVLVDENTSNNTELLNYAGDDSDDTAPGLAPLVTTLVKKVVTEVVPITGLWLMLLALALLLAGGLRLRQR